MFPDYQVILSDADNPGEYPSNADGDYVFGDRLVAVFFTSDIDRDFQPVRLKVFLGFTVPKGYLFLGKGVIDTPSTSLSVGLESENPFYVGWYKDRANVYIYSDSSTVEGRTEVVFVLS